MRHRAGIMLDSTTSRFWVFDESRPRTRSPRTRVCRVRTGAVYSSPAPPTSTTCALRETRLRASRRGLAAELRRRRARRELAAVRRPQAEPAAAEPTASVAAAEPAEVAATDAAATVAAAAASPPPPSPPPCGHAETARRAVAAPWRRRLRFRTATAPAQQRGARSARVCQRRRVRRRRARLRGQARQIAHRLQRRGPRFVRSRVAAAAPAAPRRCRRGAPGAVAPPTTDGRQDDAARSELFVGGRQAAASQTPDARGGAIMRGARSARPASPARREARRRGHRCSLHAAARVREMMPASAMKVRGLRHEARRPDAVRAALAGGGARLRARRACGRARECPTARHANEWPSVDAEVAARRRWLQVRRVPSATRRAFRPRRC